MCWPVAAAVDPTFVVAGLSLEHGTLPHRTEAFVRLALDNPQVLADPTSEPPPAEVVALLEYLEGPGPGRSEPTEIRQVGVLGEDGLPTAIDISVTTEVHTPSS